MNPLQQKCCKGLFFEHQHNPVSVESYFQIPVW